MDILTAGLMAAVILVITSLSLKMIFKQYERGVSDWGRL